MKQHAFLILAHKQPKLLGRILRVLAQDNHYFFIHIDKKSNEFAQFKQQAEGVGNVELIGNQVKVFHAGVSQIDAVLLLLKSAFNHPVDFSFYHVMSGQDYPLRSNKQFDDFFENTTHSFMYLDHGDFKRSMRDHYDNCVMLYHFNNSQLLISKLVEKLKLNKLLSYFIKRPPITGLTGAWDWFSWNKDTLSYVLDYLRQHPRYLERFNHTQCSIELVFATLLESKVELLRIEAQNPLRYISWHSHRPIDTPYRPYDLTHEDQQWVLNSKAFFCRKVDEVKSAELLDIIDQQRGNYYNIDEHQDYV